MSANQPTSASHNQLDTKAQAWSALFEEPMSDLVKRYTSSVFFDKRLWQADITGSLAHAEMLAAQGIIAAADHEAIRKGMAQITQEIESGQFEWKLDLEDVHLNIEARLTQLVGDAGKRLHTGRSRNDQVATDVRLWLRGEIDLIVQARDGTVVFVEVRSRGTRAFGGAGASIGVTKQRRIVFAARHYLMRWAAPPPCRFDVVLVEPGAGPAVQWLQAAFDAEGA